MGGSLRGWRLRDLRQVHTLAIMLCSPGVVRVLPIFKCKRRSVFRGSVTKPAARLLEMPSAQWRTEGARRAAHSEGGMQKTSLIARSARPTSASSGASRERRSKSLWRASSESPDMAAPGAPMFSSRDRIKRKIQSETALLLRARVIIAGPKTDLPLLESIRGITRYRKRSRAELASVGPCPCCA
jgi:hypothetical protein